MTPTIEPHFTTNPARSPTPQNDDPAGAQIDLCIAQHRRLQFEVARYIEQLLRELGTMARAADFQHLLHFLEMAGHEAGDQARRYQPER